MELARSFPFSLSVTAPLGFEDNPCDGAIGYKASLPSYCSSCFEESSVLSSAASILFSSPAQPQCDSPMSQPHFNVVWPVGEPNLPPALDSWVHYGVLLLRKLRVWFCSTSSSFGVPEPLQVASVKAARSHPRVSVRVFLS
ncbi:hypothetical protein Bca101_049255 [Brassica carinata]